MRTQGYSVSLAALLLPVAANAYEFNENLSIGGLLAPTMQCQSLSDAAGARDTCRAGTPLQVELSFRPTARDEVFVKLGFAAGNALNGYSPFALSPWAADLNDDLKDINGRGRDHLLNAWYSHRFEFGDTNQLTASVGIIDSTDYLDENAYANDEFMQFQNAALTNGPSVFLPSYDLGAAAQWDAGPLSVRAVLMDVGENDDGHDYRFYGVQAGYTVDSAFGSGTYRLVVAGTSQDFLDASAVRFEQRTGVLLSFDQAFGEVVGGWVRFGWQADDAAVDYAALYSGGLDIRGSAWGRADDNIGLGYALLDGGNLNIETSQVAEAYYRLQLGESFGLTGDLQYLRDDYKGGGGPSGWIYGVRLTVEY